MGTIGFLFEVVGFRVTRLDKATRLARVWALGSGAFEGLFAVP